MRFSGTRPSPRRDGAALLLFVFLLVAIVAICALAVDLGYALLVRTQLQNSADAAALAGAGQMIDDADFDLVAAEAQQFATLNASVEEAPHLVLDEDDVELGQWDEDSRTFSPTVDGHNAVRVTTRRADANGNAAPMFFASVFGLTELDLEASAVAYAPNGSVSFRFLIDDEMIDTDVESIEDLADELGMTPEDLISDNDGDGFIDLPVGHQLDVPTGQVGDEALFDITQTQGTFPFQPDADYNTADFLAEGTALQADLGTTQLQDLEWTASNAPMQTLIGKKVLDPVPGTPPVKSPATIKKLADGGATVHLSPVFKSDVSIAESDPSKYGAIASNLEGERRGLLAFKILAWKANPGGGSYLPLLTIEIVDPQSINLWDVVPGTAPSSTPRLVQ